MTALRIALFAAALTVAAPAFAPPAFADEPTAAEVKAQMMADTPNNAAAGAKPIAGDAVYKAFHEKAGIERIADDLVARATTDPRIAVHFKDTKLPRLRMLLAQQFCYLTGGPCDYTGDDMKSVHKGLALKDSDFNALAEDLQLSMDKEGVPFRAQNALLAKLAPMEHTVVTK
jgi:hemoglobin